MYLATAAFTTLILLSMCTHATFNNAAGVMVEKLRQIAVTGSRWHVVLHYNLTELFQVAHQLVNDVDSLERQFKSTPTLSIREEVQWEVTWLARHARDYSKRLNFIQSFIPHHHIQPRALLKPVGTLYHYLFGLSTDHELKHLQQKLEDQETTLAHDGQAQLTILKDEEDKISNHTHVLRQLILELNRTQATVARDTDKFYNGLREQQILSRWNSQRAEAFMELQEATANLQKFQYAVEAAGHGQLTTELITPQDLSSLLSQIQLELKQKQTNLRLPFDFSSEAIYWYYEAAGVKMGITQEDFLYAITIPLLDSNTIFDLYRIHTLPVYDSQLDAWVDWGNLHSYIAVDTTMSSYILLDDRNLQHCIDGMPAICTLTEPIYTGGRPTCELSLLNGSINHCERNIARQHDSTFTFVGSHWAYSIKGRMNLTSKCPGREDRTLTITFCGLIRDQANCTLVGPDFVLPGQTTVETTTFQTTTDVLTPLTPIPNSTLGPISLEERSQLMRDPTKFTDMLARLPSPTSSVAIQHAIAQLNASYEDAMMRHHHWKVFHWTTGTVVAIGCAIVLVIIVFKLIPWFQKPPILVMTSGAH